MELFIFWLVMAGVVAIIASSKGRGGFGWFLYGLLLWPIALVHILVQRTDTAVADRRASRDPDLRKCPRCAEFIRREARVCRFCNTELEPGR